MSAEEKKDVQERIRLRIRYSKKGPLRFTSHLDLQKIWERSFRRAQLPLAYSQGFSPHPQIQLAAALPLGIASIAEIADAIFLSPLPVPVEELPNRLKEAVPEGLEILSVTEVELKHKALQAMTVSASYRVDFYNPAGDMTGRIESVLAKSSIIRQKHNGKQYDLRLMIYSLEQTQKGPLLMKLTLSQQGGSGRPEDVLDALGLDPYDCLITRISIDFTESIM